MQNELELDGFSWALLMEMNSIDEDQLIELDNIQLNKLKVAWAYNKQVKKKEFKGADQVLKTILPVRIRDSTFNK